MTILCMTFSHDPSDLLKNQMLIKIKIIYERCEKPQKLSLFTPDYGIYEIFGSRSAFTFLFVRYPLLRNFFSVETASPTPLPFRESASCGVAE